MFRQEAEAFFGAVRFFTRLPVPHWVGHSAEMLNRSARYFSAVGLLVGATAAVGRRRVPRDHRTVHGPGAVQQAIDDGHRR